jgi:hypothetical protein
MRSQGAHWCGKGSCRILHQVGSLLLEGPVCGKGADCFALTRVQYRCTTRMLGKPHRTGECSCSDVRGGRDSAQTRDTPTHLHGFPPLEVLILRKAHIKLERHNSWCSGSWGALAHSRCRRGPSPMLTLPPGPACSAESTQGIPIHPTASKQGTPAPPHSAPCAALYPSFLSLQ